LRLWNNAFDADMICNYLTNLLTEKLHVEFMFNAKVEYAEKIGDIYKLKIDNGSCISLITF